MIPARNRAAPDAGDGNVQSAARSTTHFCSDSVVPMARPSATATIANRHLGPDATPATYQILARDPQSSKMAAVEKPDASKVLVWSLVLGLAFVIGLLLFVNHVTRSARERALAETNAEIAR